MFSTHVEWKNILIKITLYTETAFKIAQMIMSALMQLLIL
jgi:hypothetical protein